MGLRARQRVIVHLKSGESIEGLLVRKRPEVILELADLLQQNPESGEEEKVQVQGRAVFLRENVAWIQVTAL